MDISKEFDPTSQLYCELCDFIQFSSYNEFHIHHLNHIRQPLVCLVKINPKLSLKLHKKSYIVNKGVARKSQRTEHVPPLKISVINQQGLKQFQVVKKNSKLSRKGSQNQENSDLVEILNSVQNIATSEVVSEGPLEVEGKNVLERFGANVSISHKGVASANNSTKTLLEVPSAADETLKKEKVNSSPVLSVKQDDLFGRLCGNDGISTLTKPRSNCNTETKSLSKISIAAKEKLFDPNYLKKLKEQNNDNDKKVTDKNKILEKLSESSSVKPQSDKSETKECVSKEKKRTRVAKNESEYSEDQFPSMKSELEESQTNVNSRKSVGTKKSKVKSGENDSGNVLNENGSDTVEQRKFVRVKNSNYCKKNKKGPEKENSLDVHSSAEERTGSFEESREEDAEPAETGIDILERLTENLNNTVGGKNSDKIEGSEDTNANSMEGQPSLSTNSNCDTQRTEVTASQSECVSSTQETESHFNSGSALKIREEEQSCDMLLLSTEPVEQDKGKPSFSNTSPHENECFVETTNAGEENSAFASIQSADDQSQDHEQQSNSFWSDNSNTGEQSQQDPLMTTGNPVANGEAISANFLHNLMNEHQSPANIPPENSEFMSLDRLAQTQPPPYDMNSGDTNTPMEQLSQQVQRIQNSTAQINVMPSHHMPPQLHAGVPMQPPQANSYDPLGHMQQPLPPPLYQGYNMFNQNFTPSAPQQMTRPSILQQRLQARPFQSLANPRPRLRAPKRPVVRLPSTNEIPPVKQPRRMDLPLQVRPQMQNPTAKLPSGITVTPKKAAEANKVANVLASRGITVTPAVSRQTSQRPQPKSPGQSPVLNIGSGVSITSAKASQNRMSGGFVVPSPRRNQSFVNPNVERPERCTTVDLTQDDEPPQASRYKAPWRFPCKQCGIIFSSAATFESHKAAHRASTLPFKCDKCTAQFTTLAPLQQHRLSVHKTKQSAPDLAIPIVDLNQPGAREQLLSCGVHNFIPLAQLQSNNNGYFGVPIIQLDTAKEKAVSNLKSLGAGNIFVLGKMKALAPQSNH